MDRLQCIQTFAEVARSKSFTAASRRLRISKATATKHVAALESLLGAQLLTRNSQYVALTDAGKTVLDAGTRMLEDFDELGEEMRHATDTLAGTIRVGAPPSFGAFHLIPAVAAFLEKTPQVQVVMSLDDGHTNLVREGTDLSIRISAALPNTWEIAQLLGRVRQAAVAAPSYLDRTKPILRPADLQEHNCLVHSLKSPTDSWSFTGPDGPETVRVQGNIKANFGDALRAAVLGGHGIAIHPYYMIREELEAGRLRIVLPDYQPTQLDIHAIYPERRHLPRRIRAFLAFLKQWLSEQEDFRATPVG